jgi:hypothetical protein
VIAQRVIVQRETLFSPIQYVDLRGTAFLLILGERKLGDLNMGEEIGPLDGLKRRIREVS